jgi:hypothetical protein
MYRLSRSLRYRRLASLPRRIAWYRPPWSWSVVARSSSKSSTIEARSHISFLTAEGLGTHFCNWNHSSKESRVSNSYPSQRWNKSSQESEASGLLSPKARKIENMRETTNKRKLLMSLMGEESKVFKNDVLRIESISPSQPKLTDDWEIFRGLLELLIRTNSMKTWHLFRIYQLLFVVSCLRCRL